MYLKTDIEQDCGTHSSGMTYVERKTVVTSYSDYAHGGEAWDDLTEEEQEWWESTLTDLHDAYVELEELDCDTRSEAKEILEGTSFRHVDLENMADKIRSAISVAKKESARTAGWLAGKAGLPESANPYPTSIAGYNKWLEAWTLAQRD